MAQTQTPLIMRILAASIQVANRAGTIIRDVMHKGELGIVEKVNFALKSLTPGHNKFVSTFSQKMIFKQRLTDQPNDALSLH